MPSVIRENDARLSCMYITNFKYKIIMAKNVINEKGFKIIALTTEECKDIGFGFQYIDKRKDANNYCWDLVCDNCNGFLNYKKEVYYIPVLNRVFCKECLKDWYESATYYPEDKHYEIRKYDAISGSIQINGDINIKDL